jgi:hypothetical protein
MGALLALACLASVQDQDEGPDLFEWARQLEALDKSFGWGDLRARLSGAADLELFGFNKESPGVTIETPALRSHEYEHSDRTHSPAVTGRLEAFLDASYQEWLDFLAEARLDGTTSDGTVGVRIEQVWARLKIPDVPAIAFQVGKFAAPLGNFIPRAEPRQNPLVTWPLPYDWVTPLTGPGDSSAKILANRDAVAFKDWIVPIWQEVYAFGLMAMGSAGSLDYAVAAQNAAPSTIPYQWNSRIGSFRYLDVYGHASVAVDITTRIGASVSYGPYEHHPSGGNGAAGVAPFPHPDRLAQTLAGVDLHFSTGHLEIYSEAFFTRWETVQLGAPSLWTYYLEAKYTFLPGLFGAVRFAQMIFGEVRDSAGDPEDWGRDVIRGEVGGGYFFTANFFVKATLQLNQTLSGRDPMGNLVALQLGLTF